MKMNEMIEKETNLMKNSKTLADYFSDQLNLISDPVIRDFLTKYLQNEAKFVMEKPTSSSGKYHPEWQNGYCGNGIHTKNVVKILKVFNRASPQLHWDEMYASAILHDLSKYNSTQDAHTNPCHPVVESQIFWERYKDAAKENKYLRRYKKSFKLIKHLVLWHDGRFNCTFADKDKIAKNYVKGLNRKMKYQEAHLLHLADMISTNRELWSELI